MATGTGGLPDSKVETIARLAQWRIENFGACAYRRSDAFKFGIWNWYLSVEKNRYIYIRLFPEPNRLSKEQPPLAKFFVRVSNPGPGRRPCVSPGAGSCGEKTSEEDLEPFSFCVAMELELTANVGQLRTVQEFLVVAELCITPELSVNERLLRTSDDFVWPIDSLFHNRFTIDIEFLDLKISPINGGEACSIWPGEGRLSSISSNSALRCLSRMLDESIHADVVIKTSNGIMKAHKAVLASSSPVFERMFLHDLKEKESSTIEIDDMSLESCSALLGYIYGIIKQEDFWQHRLSLLAAANKYDITDLKDCCEESLMEDVNSSNVLERLHDAWLYQLSKLKKGCLTYLFDFGKIYDVTDDISSFFKQADRELMLEMFHEVLTVWKPA